MCQILLRAPVPLVRDLSMCQQTHHHPHQLQPGQRPGTDQQSCFRRSRRELQGHMLAGPLARMQYYHKG